MAGGRAWGTRRHARCSLAACSTQTDGPPAPARREHDPRPSSKAVPRKGDRKRAKGDVQGGAWCRHSAKCRGRRLAHRELSPGDCAGAGDGRGRAAPTAAVRPSGVARSGQHRHRPLAKTGPLSVHVKALWEVRRCSRPEKPSCPQGAHRGHVQTRSYSGPGATEGAEVCSCAPRAPRRPRRRGVNPGRGSRPPAAFAVLPGSFRACCHAPARKAPRLTAALCDAHPNPPQKGRREASAKPRNECAGRRGSGSWSRTLNAEFNTEGSHQPAGSPRLLPLIAPFLLH